MNRKLPRVLSGGLAILMMILIASAFVLNYEHRAAAVASIETSLTKQFNKKVELLTERISEEEFGRFALLDKPQILDEALFFITEQSVVPAVTVSVFPSILPANASTIFQQGVALLPDPAAAPFFEQAAHIQIETSKDRYLQVSSLFNLLDFLDDDSTVCRILDSLENTQAPLSDSQKRFFYSMLKEQVPDLGKIETRLFVLRGQAEQIDRVLIRKKGSYKVLIDGVVLSVRSDGFSLRYNPLWDVAEPLQIKPAPNGLLCREIVPGYYATISPKYIEEAKQEVQRQYRTSNAILSLMACMGLMLVGGTISAFRQQNRFESARTEFIATVSHELRTPLSLIRLHAETLTHGRISEPRIADYHQTILTETERLTGIVNNVLDFSRIERNQLRIHPESTNLSTLCERIIESFQSRLEKEGFLLESRIVPNMDCFTDPLAVSQIFFNLLDNAIKYSEYEKAVCVELEPSEKEIILRVSDRGIGIPDPFKKHIFDEFVRSKESSVTARRGSGIGLSVVKRLVDEMGGRIKVTDNLPQGSVFSVYLRDYDEAVSG